MKRIGTREEVVSGAAQRTAGGLTAADLFVDSKGVIKSVKAANAARQRFGHGIAGISVSGAEGGADEDSGAINGRPIVFKSTGNTASAIKRSRAKIDRALRASMPAGAAAETAHFANPRSTRASLARAAADEAHQLAAVRAAVSSAVTPAPRPPNITVDLAGAAPIAAALAHAGAPGPAGPAGPAGAPGKAVKTAKKASKSSGKAPAFPAGLKEEGSIQEVFDGKALKTKAGYRRGDLFVHKTTGVAQSPAARRSGMTIPVAEWDARANAAFAGASAGDPARARDGVTAAQPSRLAQVAADESAAAAKDRKKREKLLEAQFAAAAEQGRLGELTNVEAGEGIPEFSDADWDDMVGFIPEFAPSPEIEKSIRRAFDSSPDEAFADDDVDGSGSEPSRELSGVEQARRAAIRLMAQLEAANREMKGYGVGGPVGAGFFDNIGRALKKALPVVGRILKKPELGSLIASVATATGNPELAPIAAILPSLGSLMGGGKLKHHKAPRHMRALAVALMMRKKFKAAKERKAGKSKKGAGIRDFAARAVRAIKHVAPFAGRVLRRDEAAEAVRLFGRLIKREEDANKLADLMPKVGEWVGKHVGRGIYNDGWLAKQAAIADYRGSHGLSGVPYDAMKSYKVAGKGLGFDISGAGLRYEISGAGFLSDLGKLVKRMAPKVGKFLKRTDVGEKLQQLAAMTGNQDAIRAAQVAAQVAPQIGSLLGGSAVTPVDMTIQKILANMPVSKIRLTGPGTTVRRAGPGFWSALGTAIKRAAPKVGKALSSEQAGQAIGVIGQLLGRPEDAAKVASVAKTVGDVLQGNGVVLPGAGVMLPGAGIMLPGRGVNLPGAVEAPRYRYLSDLPNHVPFHEKQGKGLFDGVRTGGVSAQAGATSDMAFVRNGKVKYPLKAKKKALNLS